ncbi:hypothetical protein [Streptomyces sp. HUAS ZL42]|uniref:hypothetical protein n=1 Tax=Streptomyces sp. HUAS ZL42 TaxID=3231715 RepID=UPI00345EC89A
MTLRSSRSRQSKVGRAALVPVVAAVLWGTPATDAAAQPQDGQDVPDLALVTTGGTGRTTAVRAGEQFALLWQLLRPTYGGTERVPEAWVEGRYPPVRFTVVWGLTGVGGWPQSNSPPGGDVAIERQDQLFLTEDGTPWVRTDPAPTVDDDDLRWHRAPRGSFERLERAGLFAPSGSGSAAGPGSSPAEWADEHGGAWWAIPGLALGIAVGAGGTVLIRRAAARQGAGPPREEPRQELIDL